MHFVKLGGHLMPDILTWHETHNATARTDFATQSVYSYNQDRSKIKGLPLLRRLFH